MTKDYYATLGVDKNASPEDIKKAYKSLAKKYHPDINKESAASDKFKEINEAASVLGDPKKREQYDRFGSAEQGQGSNPSGFDFSGTNFDDIFDNFFSGFGFGGRGNRARQGSDLEYELEITLEEAAKGKTENLSYKNNVTCTHCKGTGSKNGDVQTCATCQGRGRVLRAQRTPFGVVQTQTACPTCHGEGKTFTNACDVCGGEGRTTERITVDIRIPAGVDNGTRLRVPGKGEAGPRGAPSGDLYITVYVRPHDVFVRKGNDLHIEVPLDFVIAALGGDIDVPTLDGTTKLRIPAGTQSETIFRIKEKGMPSLNERSIGSEKVKVTIRVPTKLTKRQKELLEEFTQTTKKKGWLFP